MGYQCAALQSHHQGFNPVLSGDRERINSQEQNETEEIPAQREVKCFPICIKEQTGWIKEQ